MSYCRTGMVTGQNRTSIGTVRERVSVGPQALDIGGWHSHSVPGHVKTVHASTHLSERDNHRVCAKMPREIKCRLLFSKYTVVEADARCKEIHGTTFEGRYISGRYICYWGYARCTL